MRNIPLSGYAASPFSCGKGDDTSSLAKPVLRCLLARAARALRAGYVSTPLNSSPAWGDKANFHE